MCVRRCKQHIESSRPPAHALSPPLSTFTWLSDDIWRQLCDVEWFAKLSSGSSDVEVAGRVKQLRTSMSALSWQSQQDSLPATAAISLTTANVGHSVRTLLWHFNIVHFSRRYFPTRQVGESLTMAWCLSLQPKGTFSPNAPETREGQGIWRPQDFLLVGLKAGLTCSIVSFVACCTVV